ncbi:type II secretion system minor pseudopilin GspI [Glaciecola sp. 2405UD65-10]|jgi:general secretion pathway protein I|uniref:type II secretion system minor pseudopilin GspI n=1 Tax=Glaciecola sp. 2405UD65-10 TaxID=3397244 RepID=UPI003B5BD10E
MNKAQSRGFTLIEVMVAVGIFAVAGAAVMKATYEHLRAVSSLEQLTFATWVANNQMTESTLRAKIQWPLKNNDKGEVELAGQRWYWKQEVKKTQDESLFQITIIVSDDVDGKNELTGVTSFIAKLES